MAENHLPLSTKAKILSVSLDLFSSQGYEAVSMRNISAGVGIRESSIYKHYAGKQAILDAIVVQCTTEMEILFETLKIPDVHDSLSCSSYLHMEIEDIARLCTKMCLAQLENEIISKFRRLLTIEQYRNPLLKKLFSEIFIERQLTYIEKIFTYLLSTNILTGNSAQTMALQFFSPFFMLQYQFADKPIQLHDLLLEHAIHFIKDHLKEE